MNEEEVKIKHVLPWLEQHGISKNEIKLECSFRVKIGKHSVLIGGEPQERKRSVAGARLDILIQRGNFNLMVVEVKAEHVEITAEDRDQAISYARLVDPIAPYALVTNGNQYLLYDVLTKDSIDPTTIRVNGFICDLPDEAVNEAKTLFLCASKANLLTFCQAQVNSELRLVKGALSDLAKKYIPELHVRRDAVFARVTTFLESGRQALVLTGQPGLGKTCELCFIAEELLRSQKPVFFLNGLHLEKDIVHAIATEFLWTFGEEEDQIAIMKRLARLAGKEVLTIIVDGIDEWSYGGRVQHLSGLLGLVESQNIRLILSCKTSSLEHFTLLRGMRTSVAELADQMEVPPFSSREFFQAIDNYRRAYAFFGGFEDVALEEARSNPFLLRVLFDVARSSKVKHLTFNSAELFETYYKRAIARTSDPDQADITLTAVADCLYEHNRDWIGEDELRGKLSLRVTEHLMKDLFEYGILVRSESSTGATVGFYFEQLRNYIIAFRAQRFHCMNVPNLARELQRIPFSGMRTDVFTLYYRLASLEHKRIWDGVPRDNALAYLRMYRSAIYDNFPLLKSRFLPYTDGKIGLIAQLSLVTRSLVAYGFRPINEGEDEILFVPNEHIFNRSNLAYLNGAASLHFVSSSEGFLENLDVQREVVEHEVLPQLPDLIKDGHLCEDNNPDLLKNFIAGTIAVHGGIFSPLLQRDSKEPKYPIDLDEAIKCLKVEKLRRHFDEELVEAKRRTGEIKETWNGSVVSYSRSITPEETANINAKALRAAELGEHPTVHARYQDLDRLERFLLPSLSALRRTTTKIEKPLFEEEAKLKEEWRCRWFLPKDLVIRYLKQLYLLFLANYATMVEANFPTLKQYFSLYSTLPVRIYFTVHETFREGSRAPSTGLNVYRCRASQTSVAVVEENVVQFSEKPWQVTHDGETHEVISWLGTTVENLLFWDSNLNGNEFNGMVLRKLVYAEIQAEWREVEQALRRKYGINSVGRQS